MKVMARTSGIAIATTKPGPDPETDEADRKHDGDRLEQGLCEAPDCLVNHFRLVGDLFDRDADRKILDDPGHRLFERFAEGRAGCRLSSCQSRARLPAFR